VGEDYWNGDGGRPDYLLWRLKSEMRRTAPAECRCCGQHRLPGRSQAAWGEWLAPALGHRPSHYGSWERGDVEIDWGVFRVICRAWDVTPAQFRRLAELIATDDGTRGPHFTVAPGVVVTQAVRALRARQERARAARSLQVPAAR